MKRRLAAWSYRRRRRVLVLWIVALIGSERDRLERGIDVLPGLLAIGNRIAAGSGSLGVTLSVTAGDEGQIVLAKSGGYPIPWSGPRMESLFAEWPTVAGVSGVVSPYSAAAGGRRVSSDGTVAYATVQFDRARRRYPDPDARRDPHADRRHRAPGRGRPDRAGRADVPAESRGRSRRADRRRRGNGDPARRVRVGARDGAADHGRVVRDRDRDRARRGVQPRGRDTELHDTARGDDRDRRRHRLRALHRHTVSPRLARRARSRGRRRPRDRHCRSRGAVRRLHGHDLHPRPLPDGRLLRAGPGGGHVGDRRPRDGGLDHVAARGTRLCRAQDRQILGAPAGQGERPPSQRLVPVEPQCPAPPVDRVPGVAGRPDHPRDPVLLDAPRLP